MDVVEPVFLWFNEERGVFLSAELRGLLQISQMKNGILVLKNLRNPRNPS